jgi:poly-gamma-glutamate biosynthesis protein PgsC/CapC
MVVPGYFALFLDRPLSIALTLVAALVTYWLVYGLSMTVIIYGKRRTVMMILVGYLVGWLIQSLPLGSVFAEPVFSPLGPESAAAFAPEMRVIGYIIPGLLAIWIDRQGLVETVSILLTAAVAVRLVLVVLGVDLGPIGGVA